MQRIAQIYVGNVVQELLITNIYFFQVNYVVQEAIVVIKDIFRKYPNKVNFSTPSLLKSLRYCHLTG